LRLLNTGTTPVASKNKLLTTIAYQLNGKRTYALEGSIFVAAAPCSGCATGSNHQESRRDRPARRTNPIRCRASIWCRPLSASAPPYWNPRVRGALFGLTRNTGPAESRTPRWKASATRPLTCGRDARRLAGREGRHIVLRVDGGMTAPTGPCSAPDLLDARSTVR